METKGKIMSCIMTTQDGIHVNPLVPVAGGGEHPPGQLPPPLGPRRHPHRARRARGRQQQEDLLTGSYTK